MHGKATLHGSSVRLVATVAGGLSRRIAAERFGVSAASAARWVHACNLTGTLCTEPQSGDTRSQPIQAFGPVMLTAAKARRDATLVELAELLRSRHDASFAASTMWRFLDRHIMTLEKSACGQAGAARCRFPARRLVRGSA